MVAFYCDLLGFRVADRGPLGPDGPEIVFLSGSSSDHHQMAFAAARGPEDASSLEHNAFRVDSLADVKEMFARLSADARVEGILPLTHGNAISVYFADPEGNGIEIFCDTPWHVQQPQARPWDPSKSEDEVLASVEADFGDAAGFMPMEAYRAEMAKTFGEA
jgi:catechol-2,3-dioxygenase